METQHVPSQSIQMSAELEGYENSYYPTIMMYTAQEMIILAVAYNQSIINTEGGLIYMKNFKYLPILLSLYLCTYHC